MRRRVAAKEYPTQVALDALELDGGGLIEGLRDELIVQGLTTAEAESLLKTWSQEFFEATGLRIISFLPRWIYDVAVPISIHPKPTALVRVGLVLRECDDLKVAETFHLAEPLDAVEQSLPIETRVVTFEEEPLIKAEKKSFELGPDGELRGVPPGEVMLSHDGKAAILRRENETRQEILFLDLEKREWVPTGSFGKQKGYATGPMAVSGDGTRIAFRAYEDSVWDLFFVDLARATRARLREYRSGVWGVALSHDGSRLVATTSSEPHKALLHVLDIDKREERVVTLPELVSDGWIQFMAISADGRKVAFTGGHGQNLDDVYVLDLQRGTILNASGSKGSNVRPSLSEDGRYLVFQSDRHRDRDLFLVDLVALTVENLTRSDADEEAPRLSADGQRVLYWKNPTLFVLDRTTGKSIPVPGAAGARPYSASLSGDGGRVLFVRRTGDEKSLILVEVPR